MLSKGREPRISKNFFCELNIRPPEVLFIIVVNRYSSPDIFSEDTQDAVDTINWLLHPLDADPFQKQHPEFLVIVIFLFPIFSLLSEADKVGQRNKPISFMYSLNFVGPSNVLYAVIEKILDKR